MTLTDEEIRVGLRQSAESFEARAKNAVMEFSGSYRKDVKLDDDGLSDVTDDVKYFISAISTVLFKTAGEMADRAFYVGYSGLERLSEMLNSALASRSYQDLTEEQQELLVQELDDYGRAKGESSWESPVPTVRQAQAVYFYMVGRRFRQYVTDSIALSELAKEFEFDD